MDLNFNLIANVIAYKVKRAQEPGLLQGSMGLCIFLYHASRKSKNDHYEQIADELLDKIFENLSSFMPTDFDKGLSGIGWGIEYLVQNGFVEGDTDHILKEIDIEVFKKLTQKNGNTFNLQIELTGYLYYVIWRLKNKNNQSVESQIKRELLILLINKINESVTFNSSTIVLDVSFDLLWDFPALLFALYEAYKLDIYSEKIERIIKHSLTNIEVYIPFMNINRIHLATTLYLIYEIVPEKRLEKQILRLLYSVDSDILITEVDKHFFNIRYGWVGFVWLLERASEILPSEFPNHSLIKNIAKEIREENSKILKSTLGELKSDNCRLGLVDGIAGIGLFELMCPCNS